MNVFKKLQRYKTDLIRADFVVGVGALKQKSQIHFAQIK